MATPVSTGRLTGVMLLVQLAGLIVPFVILQPAIGPTFLQEAASRGPSFRASVLILLGNGLLAIGIAIVAYPLLRARYYASALLLFAAGILWTALQAVDNTLLLAMLSLSEQARASGDAGLQMGGEAVRGIRRLAHYTTLLAIEGWFLAFYGALCRSRLVPRPFAVLGLLMVVAHTAGVTAPVFLDYPLTPALAPSLALSHVVLGVWLLVKGFAVE
jgi:hypothetical protein